MDWASSTISGGFSWLLDAWLYIVWFTSLPAFPVLTYAVWGVYRLMLCIGRFARYVIVQRELPILLLGVADLCQGLALIGAALLTAPHARYDFRYLLPGIRLAWGFGLPFFVIATHVESWLIARIVFLHSKDTSIETMPPSYSMTRKLFSKGRNMNTVQTKSIFSSKIAWTQVIGILLSILAITKPEMLGGINPMYIIWVQGVLTILLRFFTDQPVTLTGGPATKG